MTDYSCPSCGRQLTKRGPNMLANIKKRSIGSPFDRYVCEKCELTFSSREVEFEGESEMWF